jgi:hypothetical protein
MGTGAISNASSRSQRSSSRILMPSTIVYMPYVGRYLELRSRADRWAARRQSISDHPCDASTIASVGVREESRKIVGVVVDMPGHRCEG